MFGLKSILVMPTAGTEDAPDKWLIPLTLAFTSRDGCPWNVIRATAMVMAAMPDLWDPKRNNRFFMRCSPS